jgi:hypothetical protein
LITIETGTAEKAGWDQADRRQKLGLVWRNRKKISQIVKDYFYLPFFLLIILCPEALAIATQLQIPAALFLPTPVCYHETALQLQ